MAYLACPECGITIFDRNPLVAPEKCPRCSARRGIVVMLERIPRLGGGAAASVLRSSPAEQPDRAKGEGEMAGGDQD
jgi:DNA-directed RNA polymerase subunit RPC12/RpoP